MSITGATVDSKFENRAFKDIIFEIEFEDTTESSLPETILKKTYSSW